MCFMFSLGLFINTDTLLGIRFSQRFCISNLIKPLIKLILDGNYLERLKQLD
jgi:hypothetical protein